MAKLKTPFKFDKLSRRVDDPKAQRRYLRPKDVESLPAWNKVVVNFVTQPKTRNGDYYTKVTYFAVNADWQTAIGYFSDQDMYPLGKLLDVESIEDTDQLLGKVFFVSFGLREGDDGKQYLEITGYSWDGNNAPNGQPTPQIASGIPDDGVPF